MIWSSKLKYLLAVEARAHSTMASKEESESFTRELESFRVQCARIRDLTRCEDQRRPECLRTR